MKISELDTRNINVGIAYSIGLIYPLIKEIEYKGINHLAGQVNHQSNMITDGELTTHFKLIYDFLSTHIPEGFLLLSNSENKLSKKKGFSILIENDIAGNNDILNKMVEIIRKSDLEIKKYFVRGCFDGRSSYDKSSGYLSIDVDRDYSKQAIIKEIIASFDIDVNLNTRDSDHKKNDQIRIQRKSLKDFISKIGLFSLRRNKILLDRDK
jgi:hypothetical protein